MNHFSNLFSTRHYLLKNWKSKELRTQTIDAWLALGRISKAWHTVLYNQLHGIKEDQRFNLGRAL